MPTRITYQDCVNLTREILESPPGDWTHLLDGKPVREVARYIVGGYEVVFFRAQDYCGRWPAERFDAEAKPYEPQPEQLTLF